MSFLQNLLRNGLYQNRKLLVNARFYAANTTLEFDAKDLDKMVKTNKVVVFMKGNPGEPKCGFSNAVVQIMRMHGVQYDSFDVLQNEQLRQAIKDYSNWPTIPQVYINGEFVGGCDIMVQMHQNGELIEELKKIGLRSALLDKEPDKTETDAK